MKVSASRKTIIILSICLLLVLLGVVSLLYKDVISNGIKYGRWFSIDKYEELLDHCDWEREGKELKIKCKALLRPVSELEKKLSTHCYNFITIAKEEDKRTSLFNICEGNKNVRWDNMSDWLEEGRFTPVKYALVYKKAKRSAFKYSGLEINNATEKEYYEEIYKSKDIAEKGYAVSLDKPLPEYYYNYLYIEKDTFSIDEVGHIYVLDAKLLNIEINGKKMLLTFESVIEGEKATFTVPTTYTNLIDENNQFVSIKAQNVEILKLNNKYQIKFFFLNSKTDSFLSETEEICNEGLTSKKAFCENINIVTEETFKPTSKSEVIEKMLSKEKEILLDNTLLYYMVAKL